MEEEAKQQNSLLKATCRLLREVNEADGALITLTGAGTSVSSGVPVFRNSDGSMSPEFLAFLKGYNDARNKNRLPPVDDWFGFSVPEMFKPATEIQAWHYWRWRILRARVEPGDDYLMLNHLRDYFGHGKVFVVTSNCDMLHVKAGMSPSHVKEIHGSLGSLQCCDPCCHQLYPVDDDFITNFSNKSNPDWVPRCPECKTSCLRPNVVIFSDYSLVHDKLDQQATKYVDFQKEFGNNFVALEVGAGTVVSSIRYEAERKGNHSKGLIRINPSKEECNWEERSMDDHSKYLPLTAESKEAL